MAYTAPVPTSIYRPKKLPRVLNRQLPVLRLIALILMVGAVAVAIILRNLMYERLSLDVGLQQSRVAELGKEIRQIEGQIKLEAAYGRIAKWSLERNGWRAAHDRVAVLSLPEADLSEAAKVEAEVLGITDGERPESSDRP